MPIHADDPPIEGDIPEQTDGNTQENSGVPSVPGENRDIEDEFAGETNRSMAAETIE